MPFNLFRKRSVARIVETINRMIRELEVHKLDLGADITAIEARIAAHHVEKMNVIAEHQQAATIHANLNALVGNV